MKLWQIGILVFIFGGLINTLFLKLSITGLPRELTRLSVLTGVVLFLFGLFRPKK